ncbi:4-(cytidine 5'-diphospho)-2-C-methyl-D-erythritol kinase [Burkholderia cepacia]|uniref:4-(cytidine 5'-diphospho)-2-C-methyl-D-erythritol kinase n=1 Tax=Burkholderia cepacia TaxID=292 RepID=UPI00265002A2|nr:4-(cytidine 5'-diphospho)-2-C-methyl-D-erythritol kinase [Burkholderia cepacia]MDN7634526.1 4-(cytidine 5'-diphospho)-2-C-methyl-D-erythritol kinase [Burkholderia cepacia]
MTDSTRLLRNCLAPAKLNLFLHITGRRPNGYHDLQSVFQLLNWGDTLHFTLRDDGRVARVTDVPGVPEESDLVVRAANLLKAHTGTAHGVDIEIDKCLPMGAGLGGGSSDAATTLLALNRLWRLDLPRAELQSLAVKLGADVPFFIFGKNAFAEGIGEELAEVQLPTRWFLVVTPSVHVPTAEIFSDELLTRDTKPVTIADFLAQQTSDAGWPDSFGRNDMQEVVTRKYAEVAQAVKWLYDLTPARMTGSGASVFAAFHSKHEAEAAKAKLPASWNGAVAESLDEHPLFAFAS